MTRYGEFKVVEPPTSGEVYTRVVEALQGNKIVELVIRGEHEVPRSQNRPIKFNLKRLSLLPQGDRIEGSGLDVADIVVRLALSPGEPAIASVIFDEDQPVPVTSEP